MVPNVPIMPRHTTRLPPVPSLPTACVSDKIGVLVSQAYLAQGIIEQIMSNVPITVAHGDGIGPEIMAATLHILKKAGARLAIETIDIGEKV